MGETDRQTDKTSRWAFTAYQAQWPLFQVMPDIVAEWGWQKEVCPDTQREHYQGFIRTKRQVRFAQLIKDLKGVHLEVARNWQALQQYCKKAETAVAGSGVHQTSTSTAMTMSQALTKLACYAPYEAPATEDQLMDDTFMNKRRKDHFWAAVNNLLEEFPDEIGLYSQTVYERAYINTRRVWLEKARLEAEHSETDRQTDIELDAVLLKPAFEN